MPVTNYVYDGDNILMETDENYNPTVIYTHKPGPHGALLSQNRGGVESFVHYDGQGNVRQLTDITGTVTDTFDYNAFGEEIHRTGTTVMPFRWNGKVGYYWDTETSRHWITRRPYEPPSARWICHDLLMSINRYVYCSNSPLTYVDPSGLDARLSITACDCEIGVHCWIVKRLRKSFEKLGLGDDSGIPLAAC